ncbi:MAG TPA: hypothetical protein DD640_07805 [Clostridiales bacterium]|nr:hypothetical protein [Clostridiales bacterium]
MAEIIKAYKQNLPRVRFIGKKYGDSDRVNGGFGKQWEEWFANGWFIVLEGLAVGKSKDLYPDGDAYLGLMRWKAGEPFEYWVGMFLPPETEAPDGFGFVDFPESNLGVCWLHGKTDDIFCKEDQCAARLGEEGFEIIADENGAWWFFERYGCPRFTTPDGEGKIILDICHFVK